MSLCNNSTTEHLENILPQLGTKIFNIQNTWINSVHFRIDYWFCMTYEIWRVHSRFFSRDFPSFNKSRINRKIVWYLRTNVLGCINGLAAETTRYTHERIMGITLCALAYLVCQVSDFVTDLNLCVSDMTWISISRMDINKTFFPEFVHLIQQLHAIASGIDLFQTVLKLVQ